MQPVTNELNTLTDKVEWVHNTLANWVANALIPTKKKDEKVIVYDFGGGTFDVSVLDIAGGDEEQNGLTRHGTSGWQISTGDPLPAAARAGMRAEFEFLHVTDEGCHG